MYAVCSRAFDQSIPKTNWHAAFVHNETPHRIVHVELTLAQGSIIKACATPYLNAEGISTGKSTHGHSVLNLPIPSHPQHALIF